MMEQPPQKTPKQPKPNLLVTIQFDPQKWNHMDFLMGAIIEFFGVYLENKVKNKSTIIVTVLFDKLKDGEDFFAMLSNTYVKVSKEEC